VARGLSRWVRRFVLLRDGWASLLWRPMSGPLFGRTGTWRWVSLSRSSRVAEAPGGSAVSLTSAVSSSYLWSMATRRPIAP
jgi:hypothetical protein